MQSAPEPVDQMGLAKSVSREVGASEDLKSSHQKVPTLTQCLQPSHEHFRECRYLMVFAQHPKLLLSPAPRLLRKQHHDKDIELRLCLRGLRMACRMQYRQQ